ncbi:MAG TPA: chorismate-binding protein [Campylobacter avium]|uniref:chorismate-binding protein n=1 Tax=Campylobacter avium TaxID=522485 RepID=UPI001DAC8ADF|nr:chorismate-binding protein [Campylobacter avium]HJE65869.1 chorismate-binding protein [Campylobacter avium]
MKEAIARGQSYQLNFTQELSLHTELSGIELFKLLTKEQNTKYKMYLKSEDMEILSFSPELFFKSKKRKIVTKPMKGTISKGKNKKETQEWAKFLQNDSKNRSENVMIVDLLRNDLAHIAKAKSIKVARLFEIESYKSLLQMTSTIKAKLRKNVGLLNIFSDLFPCGSITGAPKKESMKLIKALEQRKRGVYCGALGVVHKDKSIFSVGIRSLCKSNDEKAFRYGVGSGLVWDCVCEEEQKELELKTAFLHNANVVKNAKDFYLFETMYMQNGLVLFFKEHLEWLLASARHFNFNSEKIYKDFSYFRAKKRFFTRL